ncbi:MAG: hypothetical protein MPJ08_02105 [Nitrosopumilus sp.]|nr:hypothetical protein [Nitrosopumilus sp.]
MRRKPRVYDALTAIKIPLPDGLPVLPDTGGLPDPLYEGYGDPAVVSDLLDPHLHHVYSEAHPRGGQVHTNLTRQDMLWNDRAIHHEDECLRALDALPTKSIWCAAWDGGPRFRAEDLTDLITEYNASHAGRIDHLLLNLIPYHQHSICLRMIPKCRLLDDRSGSPDGSEDIRVIASMDAGRDEPHFLYAVNSSRAFRFQSPVTFSIYNNRRGNSQIIRYTEFHRYTCGKESGFKIGLGAI